MHGTGIGIDYRPLPAQSLVCQSIQTPSRVECAPEGVLFFVSKRDKGVQL